MIQILPIDFMGVAPLLEPVDRKLHDMTVEYCSRELKGGEDLNLAKFNKVWVIVEMEGEEYKEILGISAFVWRIDLPIFRVTGKRVDYTTQMMIDRIRTYFTDNGARGTELLLHISSKETPEQKCEHWEESLAKAPAVPADRYSVKI